MSKTKLIPPTESEMLELQKIIPVGYLIAYDNNLFSIISSLVKAIKAYSEDRAEMLEEIQNLKSKLNVY